MRRLVSLAIFLSLVVLTAALASRFGGGDWYHGVMNQPGWNPPAVLTASVWAVLYVLLALAAWMVWEARRGLAWPALACWGLVLLLNAGWSWVFFGLHRVGWALGVLVMWLAASVLLVRVFRPVSREASNLVLPLAAWLVFALALNFAQWRMNGGGFG